MYDFLGFLSSFFVILSLWGVALQFSLIRKRRGFFMKGKLEPDETPTSVLSLNRFFAGFFVFFSMFTYAVTLPEVNFYIALPRVGALILIILIFFEMYRDRRDFCSSLIFWGSIILCFFVITLSFLPHRSFLSLYGVSQAMVTLSSFLLLQGGVFQIIKIRRSGRTGALSLSMHQLFALKDLLSIAFGVVLGVEYGWPVVLTHGISLIVQCMTIYHFHWVKVSSVAFNRRAYSQS